MAGGIVGTLATALCVAEKEKRERDESERIYRTEYERLMALPNCNDCSFSVDCKYAEWGETVRINCPLHTDEHGNANYTEEKGDNP